MNILLFIAQYSVKETNIIYYTIIVNIFLYPIKYIPIRINLRVSTFLQFIRDLFLRHQ